MEKIYVIVPVYRVEKYIDRCVTSVLSQTYPETKLILIDDGSDDNCGAICDRYAAENPNVTVIHKENGGLSDARNTGITHVMKTAEKTDYLTFVDSDDFVHPEFAERMIKLCGESGCGVAQCGYEKGSADTFTPRNEEFPASVEDTDRALLYYRLKSACWAKIYKVEAFTGLFYPKGMWNEDEFVTYRAVWRAKRIAFTDKPMYYYYQRSDSIMDDVARRIKHHPRRFDYLSAYEERIAYFTEIEEWDQVLKTHEKICTDLILRYCEQMYIPKKDRDEDCVNGKYMKLYREHYRIMIKRKHIPWKRKWMYRSFYYFPFTGVWMGRIFTLRK